MSNPWQKQAEVNKTAGNAVNKTGGTTSNVPPWMKNNNPPQQNPGISKQPTSQPSQPWAKNTGQQPPSSKPPSSKPPLNNNPIQQGGPPKVPNSQPWAKNQGQESPPTQPAPNNSSGQTQSSSVPPWMKNKQGGGQPNKQTGGGVAPWMKNKDSANNSKTQEISEIVQKKDDSIEKEEQIEIIPKQQSKIVEDIESQQPETETGNKKQKKEGKLQKKQKKSPQKKPPKQLKLNTPFHRYLALFAASFNIDQTEYQDRIQSQQLLLRHLNQFAKNCQQNIQKYIKDRKINQRKNNFLLLNDDTIFCKYGLVYTSTQNSSDPNIFKTQQVQKLELAFRLYGIVFTLIAKLLKKNITKKFKLRVPFITLVEYKGMQFLSESICDELTDVISSPAENYPQIQNQLNILERQLKQYFGGIQILNRKHLSLKKITIKQQQQDEDYYIIYINQNTLDYENYQYSILQKILNPNLKTNQNQLNSNLLSPSFLSDLDYFATYVDHISYLDYKILSLKIIQDDLYTSETSQKVHQFDEMKKYFMIANTIKIIYGSCQGELQQASFWHLVFQGNSGVWQLINRNMKNKIDKIQKHYLLAEMIQVVLPIKFSRKYLKKLKNINPILNLSSKSQLFPLQNLQILQVTQLFNKYISSPSNIGTHKQNLSGSLKIAQQSLNFQRKICDISRSYISQYALLQNQITYIMNIGDYKKAQKKLIKQIQKLESEGGWFKKIGLQLLLMMCYILRQTTHKNCNNDDEKQQIKKQGQQQIKKQGQQQGKQQVQKQTKQTKQGQYKQQQINKIDYEVLLLQKMMDLLQTFNKIFKVDGEIWYHANIYMIMSSYYLQKISQNTKYIRELASSSNIQSQLFSDSNLLKQPSNYSKTSNQQQILYHANKRYFDASLQFINHTLKLTLQTYGNMSPQCANIFYQNAYLQYLMQYFEQAQSYLEKSLQIYKKSSRHHKSVLDCFFLQGRIKIQSKRVQQGQQLLEQIGKQFIENNSIFDAIYVYQYLYANTPKPLSFSISTPSNYNPQQYLQNQFELCITYKILQILKRLCARLIMTQLKIHNSDKIRLIQNLFRQCLKQKDQGFYSNADEILLDIEESYKGYGNFIQMVRVNLQIIMTQKLKDSSQYEKAENIIKNIIALYTDTQFDKLLSF